MATGSYMTPIYSRSQSEVLGDLHNFCDLPMRRNEGRVVNTPLVFKRVLFQEKRKKEKVGRKKGGREKRTRRPGRGEDRRDGERKGLSPEIGGRKKDDERRWR
ncbi:hypothetical protein TNCV_1421921 [Trichonephila clavipes]|nr:hypothetical protein TNCV_1421921 [Trichonephila clavipes]